jgi:hypothetical protein
MATHIKLLIEGFLKKKKEDCAEQEKIEAILTRLLDKETKKHISLKNISKGHLVLHSDSSSFTYNFNLKKAKILKEIQKEFPQIQGVKVKIG